MAGLTNKSIEAIERKLRAGEPVKELHPDGNGLYLRCQKPSSMSFILKRWGFPTLTLGKASIGLANARQLARDAISLQASGIDPSHKKREAKASKKVQPVAELTVEETINRWLERYAKPQLRTWPEIQRCMKIDVIPKWGKLPLKGITRSMVTQLVDDIVDRGAPRQAGIVFAYIHKMFEWCVSREYLVANPAAGATKPKQAPSRERVLSDHELKLILTAVRTLGYPFQPIIELLAYSGQRKSEIGAGRWSEVDLNAQVWHLPASRTKNKTAHTFPLTPMMVEILKNLPRINRKEGKELSPYIFTTTGESVVSGYSRIKAVIDTRIAELNDGDPVPAWSFHDLRRTAATGMASLRVPVEVIEMVLNHKSGKLSGVAGIYNRFSYETEMRDALMRWDSKISALVDSHA